MREHHLTESSRNAAAGTQCRYQASHLCGVCVCGGVIAWDGSSECVCVCLWQVGWRPACSHASAAEQCAVQCSPSGSVGTNTFSFSTLLPCRAVACCAVLCCGVSSQADLVKDSGHLYFLKYLDSPEPSIDNNARAQAAFVLALVCDGHSKGQVLCAAANLLQVRGGGVTEVGGGVCWLGVANLLQVGGGVQGEGGKRDVAAGEACAFRPTKIVLTACLVSFLSALPPSVAGVPLPCPPAGAAQMVGCAAASGVRLPLQPAAAQVAVPVPGQAVRQHAGRRNSSSAGRRSRPTGGPAHGTAARAARSSRWVWAAALRAPWKAAGGGGVRGGCLKVCWTEERGVGVSLQLFCLLLCCTLMWFGYYCTTRRTEPTCCQMFRCHLAAVLCCAPVATTHSLCARQLDTLCAQATQQQGSPPQQQQQRRHGPSSSSRRGAAAAVGLRPVSPATAAAAAGCGGWWQQWWQQ